VLVASKDARFIKLSRFLLEGRGIEVSAVTAPEELVDAAAEANADVVILDAQQEVSRALQTANTTRSRRPDLAILVVGERAAERTVPGLRLYDKWDETEDLIAEIERQLADNAPPPAGIRSVAAE
jgi:CheY-like chemotaxis protein